MLFSATITKSKFSLYNIKHHLQSMILTTWLQIICMYSPWIVLFLIERSHCCLLFVILTTLALMGLARWALESELLDLLVLWIQQDQPKNSMRLLIFNFILISWISNEYFMRINSVIALCKAWNHNFKSKHYNCNVFHAYVHA